MTNYCNPVGIKLAQQQRHIHLKCFSLRVPGSMRPHSPSGLEAILTSSGRDVICLVLPPDLEKRDGLVTGDSMGCPGVVQQRQRWVMRR